MKNLKRSILFVLVALISSFALVYFVLRGSLATLDGTLVVNNFDGQAIVERDNFGIPTIRGNSRADIAFALGFIHAQDRFFQMDLIRRSASGELAELFGEAALAHDKGVRIHRFGWRAQRAYNLLDEREKQLISSYANGVNQALLALKSKPFEYWLIGQEPKPWKPKDVFLCVYSMVLDLQSKDAGYQRSLAFMEDRLPSDWFEFLRPGAARLDIGNIGHWGAFIQGQPRRVLTVPTTPMNAFLPADFISASETQWMENEPLVGSNNWGVGGSLTEHRGVMIADDMHLGLRVPNIWYRASWYIPGEGNRITGATLPGTPAMVVGSNEHIAWGFTNSYGDWSDPISLRLNAEGEYKTPEGWRAFEEIEETILVKDEPVSFVVKETIWGPVIGDDHNGNPIALRWVAHDLAASNLAIVDLEEVATAAKGIEVLAVAGMPHQNLIIGDVKGNLSWSIAGPIPKRLAARTGLEDWSEKSHNWDTYIEARDYPIFTREDQILWTANARVMEDLASYNLIGDGGYDIGARAGSIRDQLMLSSKFTEKDLLKIQLSTYNPVLDRWYEVFKETVEKSDYPEVQSRASQMSDWNASADIHSTSYGWVRAFRNRVIHHMFSPVMNLLLDEAYSGFAVGSIDNHLENPAWLLLHHRPTHALNPRFGEWNDLLELSMTESLNEVLEVGGGQLPSWGELNQVNLQHTMSRALPVLSRWLDMDIVKLPGDRGNVVRVQSTNFGASQRMVVSPGKEGSGIFHMATGQSSHPLSDFYSRGHQDWVDGNASPFLPGKAVHKLVLKSARNE